MRIDFTIPKGLKIAPSDEKKTKKQIERGAQIRKLRDWRERKPPFLLMLISLTLFS